jgi:hypothetical protein
LKPDGGIMRDLWRDCFENWVAIGCRYGRKFRKGPS